MFPLISIVNCITAIIDSPLISIGDDLIVGHRDTWLHDAHYAAYVQCCEHCLNGINCTLMYSLLMHLPDALTNTNKWENDVVYEHFMLFFWMVFPLISIGKPCDFGAPICSFWCSYARILAHFGAPICSLGGSIGGRFWPKNRPKTRFLTKSQSTAIDPNCDFYRFFGQNPGVPPGNPQFKWRFPILIDPYRAKMAPVPPKIGKNHFFWWFSSKSSIYWFLKWFFGHFCSCGGPRGPILAFNVKKRQKSRFFASWRFSEGTIKPMTNAKKRQKSRFFHQNSRPRGGKNTIFEPYRQKMTKKSIFLTFGDALVPRWYVIAHRFMYEHVHYVLIERHISLALGNLCRSGQYICTLGLFGFSVRNAMKKSLYDQKL